MTNIKQNFKKTRQEWLVSLSKIKPSPFLKDTSSIFKSDLEDYFRSLDLDPEWIVFSEWENDPAASPLMYINEDGDLVPLGCKHCLVGHRTYENHILTIAAKRAIPFSKKSTILDDFAFIYDKILFFCPYCNRLIKDYAGDLVI